MLNSGIIVSDEDGERKGDYSRGCLYGSGLVLGGFVPVGGEGGPLWCFISFSTCPTFNFCGVIHLLNISRKERLSGTETRMNGHCPLKRYVGSQ